MYDVNIKPCRKINRCYQFEYITIIISIFYNYIIYFCIWSIFAYYLCTKIRMCIGIRYLIIILFYTKLIIDIKTAANIFSISFLEVIASSSKATLFIDFSSFYIVTDVMQILKMLPIVSSASIN